MENDIQKPPPPHRGEDILVVDDTLANLELLTQMLKAHGYKVRPVTGGVAALQAAKSEPPDLILLDINMPDMSGYEVCQHLKADDALKGIPVVFISAMEAGKDKVKAFQCGGVDYITKPFWIDEVLARVKTHLHLRQLQLEVERHNVRLEETVRIRTREIAEARDQLAEAHERLTILDRAKSDFLCIISHELRTPLTGLFGIAELIMEEGRALPSMASFYEDFNQCRDKILTIVTDSLLLTQIDVDAEKFARTSTSLSSALSEAQKHSIEFANMRQVDIGTFPVFPELVIGEPELLTKALEALLETAVKFAKPGSVIRFSTGPSESGVLLMIETTGPVVPEKFLFQFFDVLTIADAIVPGGDLGLRPAVAERIISLFGGSVTVENLDLPGIRLNVRLKSGR